MQSFLKANEPDVKRRPVSHTGSLQLPQEFHQRCFQLMDEAGMIYLSTYAVKLQSLMYDITQVLINVDKIKVGLEGLYGSSERVAFVQATSRDLAAWHVRLSSLIGTVDSMLNDLVVKDNPLLTEFFQVLISHLSSALGWSQRIEHSVLLELETSPSILQSLTQTKETIERQVTVLLTNGENHQLAYAELQRIRTKLELEVQRNTRNDGNSLQELNNLLSYVSSGMKEYDKNNLMKANQTAVVDYGLQLHKLIEESESVHLSEQDVSRLQQEINKMNKNVAGLRKQIENNLKQDDDMDHQQHDQLTIQQLEEIQQSLARLSYSLNEKEKSDIPLLGSAVENMYQIRIQRENEERNDSLFEL
eukprot:TRINITY_DN7134_c1_g1_i1.p1 TRINITY_DN7134_c1_g1~~TRINITY_DN7134_c1_g1_i1.p1  ORF type:complete len:361 (-),score=81.32 TRINITY_DN7134_c1_g1_i1:162-1244(-)